MDRYYLGIDVGTSGLKTILMAADGTIVTGNTQDYPIFVPKPNWSEQDPKDWWRGYRPDLIQLGQRSWWETECEAMMAENGAAYFKGLNLFGVVE